MSAVVPLPVCLAAALFLREIPPSSTPAEESEEGGIFGFFGRIISGTVSEYFINGVSSGGGGLVVAGGGEGSISLAMGIRMGRLLDGEEFWVY
ncbi:hypothetical protein C3L33_17427, partial [Rhododendron williamsianum]